jgi:DNA polymerase III epsilon subunit-like protein
MSHYFIFWDVESTSRSPINDDIISIGAVLSKYCDQSNTFIKLDEYHSFIFTYKFIEKGAQDVHHIAQEDLKDAPTLNQALLDFSKWVSDFTTKTPDGNLYMVAHNGSRFDDIMLFSNCTHNNICFDTFLSSINCKGFLDSLSLFYSIFKQRNDCEKPFDEKAKRVTFILGECYKFYCGGDVLENAHDALADSQALFDVFNSELISKLLNLQVLLTNIRPLKDEKSRLRKKVGSVYQSKENISQQESIPEQNTKLISEFPQDQAFYEKQNPNSIFCLNCMKFTNHIECHSKTKSLK